MAYKTEAEPLRGVALDVIDGVRRIVANNPSPMTYHGTNTYLIDTAEGTIILDPGPDLEEHITAIAATVGSAATAILLTHGHQDHCGGVARLLALVDVPVYGYTPFAAPAVTIDHPLAPGDWFAGMQALFTPGHAADHLCFARQDGVVFSGDQVMAWSSSVVPFPNGSMTQFLDSLRRLEARQDRLYLPGHGPVLEHPSAHIADLIAHRMRREQDILHALEAGPNSSGGLAATLYANRGERLMRASEQNVKSHLAKLQAEGRVKEDDGLWQATGAI